MDCGDGGSAAGPRRRPHHLRAQSLPAHRKGPAGASGNEHSADRERVQLHANQPGTHAVYAQGVEGAAAEVRARAPARCGHHAVWAAGIGPDGSHFRQRLRLRPGPRDDHQPGRRRNRTAGGERDDSHTRVEWRGERHNQQHHPRANAGADLPPKDGRGFDHAAGGVSAAARCGHFRGRGLRLENWRGGAEQPGPHDDQQQRQARGGRCGARHPAAVVGPGFAGECDPELRNREWQRGSGDCAFPQRWDGGEDRSAGSRADEDRYWRYGRRSGRADLDGHEEPADPGRFGRWCAVRFGAGERDDARVGQRWNAAV